MRGAGILVGLFVRAGEGMTMARGVKGSGKAAAKKARPADVDDVFDDDAPSRLPQDGKARCRIDGTPHENGICPSCSRRAMRFNRIAELEAELKQLKVKACGICEAPGARKSAKYPHPICPTCRTLAAKEAKLKAKLAKARKPTVEAAR
jgi:hypothetical protein